MRSKLWRLLLSCVGGIVLPLLLMLLWLAIESLGLKMPHWVSEALFVMAIWPSFILTALFGQITVEGSDALRPSMHVPFLLIHFLTFFLLTYLVLRLLARRKKAGSG